MSSAKPSTAPSASVSKTPARPSAAPRKAVAAAAAPAAASAAKRTPARSPAPSPKPSAAAKPSGTVRSAMSADPATPATPKGKTAVAAASPASSGRRKSTKDPNAPVHNLSFGHPPATAVAMYADPTDAADAATAAPVAAAPCPSLALYGDIAARAVAADAAGSPAGEGSSALFTIGWMYYFGLGGCAVSRKKAYAYFYAAAKRSDPLAQYYCGVQLLAGDGCRKDPPAGLAFLLEAAEDGGLDVAMFAAGKLLWAGTPCGKIAPDHDRAVALIEAAEKLRNVPAINRMTQIRRCSSGGSLGKVLMAKAVSEAAATAAVAAE